MYSCKCSDYTVKHLGEVVRKKYVHKYIYSTSPRGFSVKYATINNKNAYTVLAMLCCTDSSVYYLVSQRCHAHVSTIQCFLVVFLPIIITLLCVGYDMKLPNEAHTVGLSWLYLILNKSKWNNCFIKNTYTPQKLI